MAIVRSQPYGNDQFVVSIGGNAEETFAEVRLPTLLDSSVEYRAGGDASGVARHLPGRATYTTLTLKRGFNGALDLYEWWRQATGDGPSAKRQVKVSLLDEAGHVVVTWVVSGAWPVRYAFTPLVAQSGAVLQEEVELACDGVEMS